MQFHLVVILLACSFPSAWTNRFICYFPNWAPYRPGRYFMSLFCRVFEIFFSFTGAGKFTVDNIDPGLCTHLIYGFATLDPSNHTIQVRDIGINADRKMYTRFVGLKEKNPSLKTMISIGGWQDFESTKYTQLVTDPQKTDKFVTSIVYFLKKYNFDGLEIDFEFPSSLVAQKDETRLLAALKKAFEPKQFLLSVAVSSVQAIIDASNPLFSC